LLYSKDDAAAKVDLAEAKGHLQEAAEQSTPETRAKVQEVVGLVKGLEDGIGSDEGGAGDEAAFHKGWETGRGGIRRRRMRRR